MSQTLGVLSDAAAGRGNELMYIGGSWVPATSGEVIDSVNPTTEAVIASVPAGAAADIDIAVAAARSAARSWADQPWQARGRKLAELAARIRSRVDEIAMLDARDAGLPLRAMRTDVLGAATDLEYFAGIGGELKGFTGPQSAAALAYTVREPYGVVGRITPYNHPFRFAVGKVAAPLMAGNPVVLKPPETASLSSIVFARLAEDLFPPGVLNVVTGRGVDAGAALASHPNVPRVSFSGGLAAGRSVLHAGAEHIKHVTVELGGKNPLIVCPDANPDQTAAAAVLGMNFTSTMGQSCMSTSRVFVHESLYGEFVAALLQKVQALRIGDPCDEHTQIGPLAFRAHFERVISYIEIGQSEGATLLTGGGRPDGFPTGYFIEPAIFIDVAPTMRIAQEEIFGPVVVVMPWKEEEELFQLVNGVEQGLTASIWTDDLRSAQRFTARVEAGLVWVNGSVGKPAGMPFGGFKYSGLGKESCLEELLSYTREKCVISSLADG